jgi:anti-sigma-K factor RskA
MDLTPWRGLRVASVVVAVLAIALYFSLWQLASPG